MRQGLVFVSCVWALAIGCKSEPLGVEGWVEAQRAAAESVCGCASAIGRSVESCFEDFDTSEYGESYTCVEEGLAADPEAIELIDCYAESFWKLDRCASTDTCEEDKVERCIDQHEVRVRRCPADRPVFADAHRLCRARVDVARDPVNRYVDAVAGQHGYSYEWRRCVLPIFSEYEFYVREPAICAVPHIDRYNECVRMGEDECERLLTPTYACPTLPQELLDWQVTCLERG